MELSACNELPLERVPAFQAANPQTSEGSPLSGGAHYIPRDHIRAPYTLMSCCELTMSALFSMILILSS